MDVENKEEASRKRRKEVVHVRAEVEGCGVMWDKRFPARM